MEDKVSISKEAKAKQIDLAYNDEPTSVKISTGKVIDITTSKNATMDLASKHFMLQDNIDGKAPSQFIAKFKNVRHQSRALAIIVLNDYEKINSKPKFPWGKSVFDKTCDEIYQKWNQQDVLSVIEAWIKKMDLSFFFQNTALTLGVENLQSQEKSPEQKPSAQKQE